MEQIRLPELKTHELVADSGACVNCEVRAALPGYSTKLCDECRKLHIKYPIPLWIKLFAGGVCLVILFSLFTFPENLSAAIHLARGKKAADNSSYVTARNELQKVVVKHPQHVEARAYLMLASFYNEDYDAFLKYSEELQGVDIGNDELVSKLIDAQHAAEAYLSDDSIQLFQKLYEVLGRPVPDSMLSQFLQRYPDNNCALYMYASNLYDAKRYVACDSVLLRLLEMDDTYIPTLQLMANAKRQQGDYNAAIKYCERALDINKESAYTYGLMARTYLQQRRDREGLDMAYKAMSIDGKFPYVRATMALAYHFTHQFEKRDEMVKEAKASKDPASNFDFEYVYDVMANKTPFR